jgi:hypothetical protein
MPNPYIVVAQATPTPYLKICMTCYRGVTSQLSIGSRCTTKRVFEWYKVWWYGDSTFFASASHFIFDRRQSILHPNVGGTSRECSSACCVPLTMTLQQLEKSIVEFSVVLRGLLIHSCKETCNKGKEEPSRSCNPGPLM